jgi:hypothetical protein
MTIGTVRWYDVRKGYGFLKLDDGGVDVLVDIPDRALHVTVGGKAVGRTLVLCAGDDGVWLNVVRP